MKDSIIIRMAEETSRAVQDMDPHIEAPRLASSYNAILHAAKANHPEDAFLSNLAPINNDDLSDVRTGELRVLLGLMRLALESLLEERASEDWIQRDQELARSQGFSEPTAEY